MLARHLGLYQSHIQSQRKPEKVTAAPNKDCTMMQQQGNMYHKREFDCVELGGDAGFSPVPYSSTDVTRERSETARWIFPKTKTLNQMN